MTCKTLELCSERACEAVIEGNTKGISDCSNCQNLYTQINAAIQNLGLLSMQHQPPTRVKADLMKRILKNHENSEQPWKTWTNQVYNEGMQVIPGSEKEWKSTEHAGVFVKKLAILEGGDKIKMLVKMEPGTAYPPHIHSGFEDCYVLQGELNVGALTLRQGDYQCSDQGSIHASQSTDTGCLLLITSSTHDELFPQT